MFVIVVCCCFGWVLFVMCRVFVDCLLCCLWLVVCLLLFVDRRVLSGAWSALLAVGCSLRVAGCVLFDLVWGMCFVAVSCMLFVTCCFVVVGVVLIVGCWWLLAVCQVLLVDCLCVWCLRWFVRYALFAGRCSSCAVPCLCLFDVCCALNDVRCSFPLRVVY